MRASVGPSGDFRFCGKLAKPEDSRDLKLAKYLDKAKLITAAETPLNCDWTAMPGVTGAVPTPDRDPLYNNVAGCCVYSAPAHMLNLIGKQIADSALVVTAGMVQRAYSAATGYDPFTGANDTGYVVRDMLKEWQQSGLYGTKLLAFAAVNWNDPDEVALAVWLAGGLIGGYALPAASESQSDAQGRPQWSVPAGGFPAGQGPGTWGGHCIYSHGCDNGNTWGQGVIWTPEWKAQCCDELWLPLVDRWGMPTGRAPDGFAMADLLADVEARQA